MNRLRYLVRFDDGEEAGDLCLGELFHPADATQQQQEQQQQRQQQHQQQQEQQQQQQQQQQAADGACTGVVKGAKVRRKYLGYGTYDGQIKDISTDRKTVTVEFDNESDDGEYYWTMDEAERGVAMKENGKGEAAGKRKAGAAASARVEPRRAAASGGLADDEQPVRSSSSDDGSEPGDDDRHGGKKTPVTKKRSDWAEACAKLDDDQLADVVHASVSLTEVCLCAA